MYRRKLLTGSLALFLSVLGFGGARVFARAAGQSPLPEVDPHKAFGSKSAPIAMETFSDFECPACRQFYLNNYRLVMENYVDTGKVYLVERDFPLPVHAYSTVAARYARAAAQIGKFEQVQDALFQNQSSWEQSGDVDGTIAKALTPAEMNKVRLLAKSPAIDAAVEKDKALGRQYAVNQTPTTYIHFKGQTYPVVGVVSYDVLHQFLDQLLAQR